MIKEYINEIAVYKRFSMDRLEDVVEYTFIGDGQGDFEERSGDATVEALENYIIHLEKQKSIAKQVLKEKKESNNESIKY